MWKFIKRRKWTISFIALIAVIGISGLQFDVVPKDSTQTIGQGTVVLKIGTAEASAIVDYTCDGTDDNIQFQGALDALPANGGTIEILAGNYDFTNGTTVTRALDNVTIIGTGRGTYITCDGVTAIFTAGGNNWTIKDLRTDAGGLNMGATTGWSWENVTINADYYAYRTPRATTTGADWEIPTGRGATYVVAASDAPAQVKAQADYICDGTNDQVEIQAAIDACPATGGVVELSTGTFSVVPSINIDSGITVIGQGVSTLINVQEGTAAVWDAFYTNTESDIRLSSIKFNLGGNLHATAFHFLNITRLMVDNLIITNGDIDSSYSGSAVQSSTDAVVCYCTVDSVYNFGLSNSTNSAFIRINLDNTFDNGLICGDNTGLRILECKVNNVPYGIDIGSSNNVVISGCTVTNAKSLSCINVEPTAAGVLTYAVTIDNNYLYVNSVNRYGIQFANAGGGSATEVAITNNHINNSKYGIMFSCAVSQFVISNNNIDTSGRGMEILGASDGVISNNVLLDCGSDYASIHLSGSCSYISVIGNTIDGTTGTNPAIADESGTPGSYLVATGNVLKNIGATTKISWSAGARTTSTIANNIGFVAAGEIRYIRVNITAGVQNTVTSLQNLFGSDVLIIDAYIAINTAASATNPTYDMGTDDDGAGAPSVGNNIFEAIPDTVGYYRSISNGLGGDASGVLVQPILWATSGNDWVNFIIVDAAGADTAGVIYITVIGK